MEFYSSNSMKLNDDKTMILILKETYSRKINIAATNGKIISNSAQIKILGVYINQYSPHRKREEKPHIQWDNLIVQNTRTHVLIGTKFFQEIIKVHERRHSERE